MSRSATARGSHATRTGSTASRSRRRRQHVLGEVLAKGGDPHALAFPPAAHGPGAGQRVPVLTATGMICTMSDTRASMSAGGHAASNSPAVQQPDFDGVGFSSKDVRVAIEEYAGRAILFRQCDFTRAEMQDLDLTGAVFDQCRLDGAKLRECVLDRAHIIGGSCVAADFASADLNDAVFHGVELSRTRFTGALLADVRFEECRMIGADLTALRGLAVTLTIKECNLQLANFQDTDLRGADLTGSDLTEADLRGTDLRDAVFSRCRLRGADLSHTRLAGADLRGADLGEITADMLGQLRGAIISHAQAADICAALGLTVLD